MADQIVMDQSIQPDELRRPPHKGGVKSHGSDIPTGEGLPKGDYFLIVFAVLLSAMETRQNTVLSQSKILSTNSSAQNRLNKENGAIKFSMIPYKAGTATINRVQAQNEEYAAMRENLQNMLITCRQTAQVEMTQTSTNVQILEQDASEDSKWVGTLNTIFQVINDMTKR
ncbi:MAG: DUF720 domain-containing protein [Chlamydiales bacterium]|nr:DUF720 domain-containing protein [Chlamydiales bacterium]